MRCECAASASTRLTDRLLLCTASAPQGWAAARGELDWAVVGPLYGAGGAWTLVYDTIYAHQDAVDDAAIGVRSTALRFGADTPRWLSGFSVAAVAGLAQAGHAVGVGWPYYAGVAAAGAHLAWQARCWLHGGAVHAR